MTDRKGRHYSRLMLCSPLFMQLVIVKNLEKLNGKPLSDLSTLVDVFRAGKIYQNLTM